MSDELEEAADAEAGADPDAEASAKPAKPEKKKKEKKPKKPKAAKPKDVKGAKKKGPNFVVLLIPVAVIAALVLAFTLPPTHAMIVNGPLKPLLAKIGLVPKTDASATAKAAATPDPTAEAKRLADELDASKRDAASKDAQIAQLTSQVKDLSAVPSPSPSPKATPGVVSDDVKRVAEYWASMDADKAAEIAGRLPDAYVKLVFSVMPADAVADIMSALPTKTVARLTGPVVASAPAHDKTAP